MAGDQTQVDTGIAVIAQVMVVGCIALGEAFKDHADVAEGPVFVIAIREIRVSVAHQAYKFECRVGRPVQAYGASSGFLSIMAGLVRERGAGDRKSVV